jgi:hypothetical protein
MQALVSSRQRHERHLQAILASTKGIIFLGTPHNGSSLAVWAERLSTSIGLIKQTNPHIVEVLRRDSEVLARIQDSFHAMIQSRTKQGLSAIEITCFYEEVPMPGVGLVCVHAYKSGTRLAHDVTNSEPRLCLHTLRYFQAISQSEFTATTRE